MEPCGVAAPARPVLGRDTAAGAAVSLLGLFVLLPALALLSDTTFAVFAEQTSEGSATVAGTRRCVACS